MGTVRNLSRLVVGLVLSMVVMASSAFAQQASALDDIQKRGVLKVGWATVYPDFYRDAATGGFRGSSFDIVEDLAKTLGVKLELVEDSWATLVAGIQSGKFDMTIPSLGITLPRALAISYSEPVYSNSVGLMIRKQDGERFKTLQDFDKPEIRLSVTLGSNADMFLTRAMKSAQILRVKAAPDSIAQLLSNRADAWVSPTQSFAKVAAEQTSLAEFTGGNIGDSPIAFGFRAGDYRLKEWLDYYVNELRNTGQLQQILDRNRQ